MTTNKNKQSIEGITMNSNFKRLFFITILSSTMAACTPNPVVDNNNTTVGSYNSNNNNPANNNPNTAINTSTQTDTTTSIDGYIYNGGYTNSTNDSINNNTDISTGVVINNESNEVNNNMTTNTNNENYTSNQGQKGFVVQLTASISQAKTDKIRDTFVAEGYPVIQNSINRDGQILYRVQIGPYATKEKARAIFAQLKNRYKRNPFVNSAFINENK